MSDKMSDAEFLRQDEQDALRLHESRETLNCTYQDDKAALLLRDRLIEARRALGEIDGLLQHQLDNEEPDDLVTILQLLDVLKQIAGKHYRGGK